MKTISVYSTNGKRFGFVADKAINTRLHCEADPDCELEATIQVRIDSEDGVEYRLMCNGHLPRCQAPSAFDGVVCGLNIGHPQAHKAEKNENAITWPNENHQ